MYYTGKYSVVHRTKRTAVYMSNNCVRLLIRYYIYIADNLAIVIYVCRIIVY